MNVGRISGSSNLYYASGVNRIGSAGLSPSGSQPRGAVPVAAGVVSPEKNAGSAGTQLAAVYSNSDGDSAEITNKAMDLWRNKMSGNDSSPAQTLSPQNNTNTPFNYKLNLPSPFLNWEQILENWESPSNFKNAPAPDIAPPNAALPNVSPPGGTPPDIGSPGINTGSSEFNPIEPKGTCSTCESRRYVDKSDDASVSFQTPTKVDPNMAMGAVAAHENEHVKNEKSKAQREDREIVSQTVTMTYDTCPECGRHYVSGGTTRTTTIGKSDDGSKPESANPPENNNPDNGSKE